MKAQANLTMVFSANLIILHVGAQCRSATVGTPLLPSASCILHINVFHSGPGFRISDFESNKIIGNLQFQGAQKVMNGVMNNVNGGVRSVHVYMNMQVHSGLRLSPDLGI